MKGEYAKAIVDFCEAIRLDASFISPHSNRGVAYFEQQEYDKAIVDWVWVMERDRKCFKQTRKQFVELAEQMGQARLDRKDWERAIGHLTQALRIATLAPSTGELFKDAPSTMKVEKLGFKVPLVTNADKPATGDEKNPETASVHYKRGLAYLGKGDTTKALMDFTAAINVNPQYREAFVQRAAILHARQKFDEEIKDLSRVLAIDRYDPQAYLQRGLAYSAKGDRAAAFHDFSDAIRYDPRSPQAYYERAIVLERDGELTAAMTDLDTALRINPQYAEALQRRTTLERHKAEQAKREVGAVK